MSEAPQTAPVEQPPVTELPAASASLGPLLTPPPQAPARSGRDAHDLVAEVRAALATLRGTHLYAHQGWRTDDGTVQGMVLVRIPGVITSPHGMHVLRTIFGAAEPLCEAVEGLLAKSGEQRERARRVEAEAEVRQLQGEVEVLRGQLSQAREELLAREHLLGDIRHAEYQVQVLGERVDRQAEELRRARIDAALIYADRVAADPLAVGASGQEAQELAARACYRAGTYYTRSEAQRAMARVAGLPVPGAPRRVRGRGGRGGRRG